MMKSILSLFALLPLAWTQNLCGQYDYYSANGYYFNNNAWGSSAGTGSQCTYVDKLLNPGVAWHSQWNWAGGDNNVKSYPYSGRTLASKKLVSNIGSIPTKAEWRYLGDNIRADVAYDLFTAANPNHDPSSGDYELMVWLARKGGVYPIGSSQGYVTVAGQSWELFVGYNGATKVFSFVAPNEIATFESDIKPFFTYITNSQGFPASQQYLITFQFGSEPFTGQNSRFDVWYWYGEVN
ncbi:endoglucanase [Xylariaceae sp. FL1651]|nr:endoglucanase [Xylariaceae sp. FL1651]